MAIVKCMNPECDYFERAVPEDDCCPYCGEPLNMEAASSQATPQYYSPPEPEPVPVPSVPYHRAPVRTVVELPNLSLRLVHTNSGETFTVDRDTAMNKMYLGRQDGIPSDRPVIDVSKIPCSERVSRLHAYISWDHNHNNFNIVDDNSTNGTILNGKPLTPQQPYALKNGDRIEFGREHKVIFRVEVI